MLLTGVCVSLHVLGGQPFIYFFWGGVSQQVRDDAVVSREGVCSAKCVRGNREVSARPCERGRTSLGVLPPLSVRPTSSVMESREDVASSYRRTGGFFRMARAMATRCFSPPESKQQVSQIKADRTRRRVCSNAGLKKGTLFFFFN